MDESYFRQLYKHTIQKIYLEFTYWINFVAFISVFNLRQSFFLRRDFTDTVNQ